MTSAQRPTGPRPPWKHPPPPAAPPLRPGSRHGAEPPGRGPRTWIFRRPAAACSLPLGRGPRRQGRSPRWPHLSGCPPRALSARSATGTASQRLRWTVRVVTAMRRARQTRSLAQTRTRAKAAPSSPLLPCRCRCRCWRPRTGQPPTCRPPLPGRGQDLPHSRQMDPGLLARARPELETGRQSQPVRWSCPQATHPPRVPLRAPLLLLVPLVLPSARCPWPGSPPPHPAPAPPPPRR